MATRTEQTVVYAAGVWILRVPEARQIRALIAGRLSGPRGPTG